MILLELKRKNSKQANCDLGNYLEEGDRGKEPDSMFLELGRRSAVRTSIHSQRAELSMAKVQGVHAYYRNRAMKGMLHFSE